MLGGSVVFGEELGDAGVAEVLTCGAVLLQDGVGGQDHRSIAISM